MSRAPDSGGSDTGTVRWRMRLAYDGAGFHGFAINNGQRTVAGELTEALERVARVPLTLTCAGRTDTGVHALDQVIHFDVPVEASARLEPSALVRSCNSQLSPAIVVREASPVEDDFDARRSAISRRYRYLVLNAPVNDPLLAPLAWHVCDPLDLRSMAAAADAVVGEHDFRAFCRRPVGMTVDTLLERKVTDARWSRLAEAGTSDRAVGRRPAAQAALAPAVGELLAFEIEANAFCHRMVRSIVGTLVDVGRGRRQAADMMWILRSFDRGQASQPAPAHGLTLIAVHY